MKRNILTLMLAIVFLSTGYAQVTINTSIFPVAGDTLQVVSDPTFTAFDAATTGENVIWDFSSLNGTFLIRTPYTDASSGSSADLFPEADLLQENGVQQIYYETKDDRIVEIGRSGLDPVLNAIDFTFRNEGEAILRRAPMNYEDMFMEESSFVVEAPCEILPDTLIPDGVCGLLVDSIRLAISTSIVDEIDGYGTAIMPDGEYDVLRNSRETTTTAEAFVKNPFFGWQPVDPTNEIFAAFGDLLDLLGENVSNSYQFYANDTKEILVDVLVDEEGDVINTTYKGDVSTNTISINVDERDVIAYPNPTYGDITFELRNLPRDNYKVHVYNIIGRHIWTENISIAETKYRADLSHLKKGTYIYSVVDGQGRKITTKRLIILKP